MTGCGATPDARCPCGTESAGVLTVNRQAPIRQCKQCGLLIRAPFPSAQELGVRYQEEYWHTYRNEQVTDARRNVYADVLRWIGEWGPRPGTLVDVGCGGGGFLAACREAGWQGIGFDPSPDAVAYARSLGLNAEVQSWPPAPLGDEAVDVVTFINVLDHLVNPFDALREAWRVLRPSGLLYIRVPNGPFHAGLLRCAWSGMLQRVAVFHLYGFGRKAFLYHLPRLRFRVLSVRAARPSQGNAYEHGSGMAKMIAVLKRNDGLLHRLLCWTGLADRAWGPSIEVMARKEGS